MVWVNSEYENFYCFGCQSHHNIINLVSYLEGISKQDAIKILSGGLNITVEDEQKLAQAEFVKAKQLNPVDDLSDNLLFISRICNLFLESVDYDPKEYEIIDNVWKFLDKSLLEYDIEAIESLYQNIENVIQLRIDKINGLRTQKLATKYSENKDGG